MISSFDEIPTLHKKVFCTLYKEYLKQNNHLYIDNSDEIVENFFPEISSDKMSAICWNLKDKELLICYPGDDLATEISLTDDAIAFMEHRFKNNIKNIINFITSLS
ncbi:MAG: hypothetical protein E7F83_16810 [Clostridium sp.]|uniref:hypothetical protein n=1 Tax=Clostridium sp. TaxID=1506 RepID=UPI002910FC10|nr:hypothetical protein [Clostridium sp.]MDU3549068.1 hypothetical protein [Clostridium sp.]